jgi:apolipoprotein N-acyltransferase
MAGITHLVWPESSFPFLLAREPAALAQISGLLDRKAVLITGAVRASERLPGETGRRFYNAIQVVAADGTVVDSADKTHLVPFGEYLPMSDLLTTLGLRQFVQAPGGFDAGTHRKLLSVPGLPPAAALVCYEAIFPGDVLPEGARPGLMINVTNDAWFGVTPGPHQHFAQARLRTIEEGLPLVRGANTGISAVVDPFGRVIAALPLGVEGVLDSALPEALPATIFAINGTLWWLFVLIVFALISGICLRTI